MVALWHSERRERDPNYRQQKQISKRSESNEQGPIQVYLVLNIKEHVIGIDGGEGAVLTVGSVWKSS